MTNDTTAAGPRATEPHYCEHCNDSVPHEHLDIKAVVAGARRDALREAGWMTAASAVAAGAAAGLAAVAAGTAPALTALGVTVAGWVVTTLAGLGVLGATRARLADSGAVLAGSFTTAALTPLVALAVALLTGGGWAVALVAGAAWLLCGALAALARARTYRALLLQPGEAGERARSAAVARSRRPGRREPVSWLLQAVAVAVCVWALTPLPALVVVLVPLAVVGVVAQARRRQGR
ncbi:hypothetical protein [Georgenia sp. AZ-5]|uniref:hypothetical protein n=1 Tax=Georgenia sp. AZ-5 TaxID=3367526 RepID=UPI0037551BAB